MGEFYERYLPPVWRYVCTQLDGDRQGAEDVVGETFLAALRGVKGLDPDGGSVCGWLIGVARHKLLDHWRRMRRARDASAATNCEPVDSRGPHDPLAAAESNAQVAEAMARLADEERVVLEWKYLDDLPVREIADRLGLPVKAAEALLYRARRSFRAVYQGLQGREE